MVTGVNSELGGSESCYVKDGEPNGKELGCDI